MKKLLSFSLVLVVLMAFPNCKKETGCKPKAVGSETASMQAYAQLNSITPTTHSTGMLYQIIDAGSGTTASVNSKIYIKYTGKFLNGTQFDQQLDATKTGWPLSGLIEGWRVGIPLVQKGGHIKLIVPSSMAYGCEPYGIIPGNSILYFDIEVVDIQ